ncbi:uncharacterized protein [Apostichopus japonicus]|uniref:uncharacterized protein n=1 Tax=Stichopus japonicus TaxID=307972 RepID=UPI003AB561BC
MALSRWFLFILLVFQNYDQVRGDGCEPTQYLVVGKPGKLECAFATDVHGIVWYNSTNTVNEQPIIKVIRSKKSGVGFETGEFDVDVDGSLILKEVCIQHENTYTALKFQSQVESPTVHVIRAVTLVKPLRAFPLIDECGDVKQSCFIKLESGSQAHCSIERTKPMVELYWTKRTEHGDIYITSQETDLVHEGATSSSFATVTINDISSTLLSLLVCNANFSHGLLESNESQVLVEHEKVKESAVEPVNLWFEKGSTVHLNCSNGEMNYLLWKKYDDNMNEDLAVAFSIGEEAVEVLSNDFELEMYGSLTIDQINVQREGVYACIYNGGLVDNVNMYNVSVYITPRTLNPVIHGCIEQSYCVLEVNKVGTVSCSYYGVRPEVNLSLKTFYDSDSEMLSFSDEQRNVKTNGETFDVTLTSQYMLQSTTRNRITLECSVSGGNFDLFDNSQKFDLLFHKDSELFTDQTTRNDPTGTLKTYTLIAVSLAIFTLVTMAVIISLIVFSKVKKHRNHQREKATEAEEGIPMMYPEKQDISDKTASFLNEIRIKYETLYNSVTPVPFKLDDKYSMDHIYVENGIELKLSSSESKRSKQINLSSPGSILDDHRMTSHLRMVVGDPGIGKSTLALKLVYDWCKQTSPLKKFDILVYLRLRNLASINSIYDAIQLSLLPRDTLLTGSDIKNILQNAKSGILILDGYDEYPNEDKNSNNDIKHILNREMFQHFTIILTTRTQYLPSDITPRSDIVRLTGFNEAAQEAYIRKVIEQGQLQEAQNIKDRLQRNPILGDFCQVPLFFVMYVHLAPELGDDLSIYTATSFFRFLVSCLHSHFMRKNPTMERNKTQQFEKNHGKLDKIAFDSLMENNNHATWTRDEMCKELGDEFYEYYIKVGILAEEEVLFIDNKPGISESEHIYTKINVRFFHKLFCEWYAAHFLSQFSEDSSGVKLRKTLKCLDPFILQYVYRFACGLNPESSSEIIKYLQSTPDGDMFVNLCILEQSGNVESIKEAVQELSLGKVQINSESSRLLQRSTLQIIDIASAMKIQINCFHLENCFNDVNLEKGCITLNSEVQICKLTFVKELKITEMGRELVLREVIDILDYSSSCGGIETVTFDCCLLPYKLEDKYVFNRLRKTNIKITWIPVGTWYRLRDLSHWEDMYEGNKMTHTDYLSEVENFREEWSDTERQINRKSQKQR